MDLHTKVIEAGRNYKMYAGRLARLGIFTLEDFLFHIPFRYEDFSIISKIEQIHAGETVTVRGKIKKIENNYTKKWKSLQKALVGDDTGEIDIIWFNQPYIAKTLKVGDDVSLSGKFP